MGEIYSGVLRGSATEVFLEFALWLLLALVVVAYSAYVIEKERREVRHEIEMSCVCVSHSTPHHTRTHKYTATDARSTVHGHETFDFVLSRTGVREAPAG